MAEVPFAATVEELMLSAVLDGAVILFRIDMRVDPDSDMPWVNGGLISSSLRLCVTTDGLSRDKWFCESTLPGFRSPVLVARATDAGLEIVDAPCRPR